MRQETDQLWSQVVEWRKRELNQWKDILQNTIKQEGRKAREIFPQLFLSLDSDDLEVVRLAAINFIIEAKLGCPYKRVRIGTSGIFSSWRIWLKNLEK